eukprot:2130368-Pyramimonas_sp.AAC.1
MEQYIPVYDQEEFNAHVTTMRKAGADLLRHFEGLYAVGKISAQDFAVSCHLAFEAGCFGGDFLKYSQPPGLLSGRYQQYLDAQLQGTNLHAYIDVP